MVDRAEPETTPEIDPYNPGSSVHGDVRAVLQAYEDAFGNVITNRTSVLNVPSHYPYSPERWRLFVNGSRKFPEYNSVAEYNHAGDFHELKPSGGDTVTFETAERPRYVVQYGLAATFAVAINQDLQTGDSIKIGLYDGTDGWYVEHDGSHSNTQADVVAERDGSEVYRRTDQDIHKTIRTNARFKADTGWYDITRQRWERSYSDSGEQRNPEIIETSADDQRGPKTGNLPAYFEVVADANTSGLILEAGSCAQVNLGTTIERDRGKQFDGEYTFATTGSWVPIRAYRVAPDRNIVNVQLDRFEVTRWDGADDVELELRGHASQNVQDSNGNELTDGDFSPAGTLQGQSSVMEEATAVAQAADSTGSVTTSASKPGAFQIARAINRTSSGKGGGATRSASQVLNPIYGRDVVVLWGLADNSQTVAWEATAGEDW